MIPESVYPDVEPSKRKRQHGENKRHFDSYRDCVAQWGPVIKNEIS